MLAIVLCWMVALVGGRMGRFLEWMGVPRVSLPPFCRRPVGEDEFSMATPPPPPPPGSPPPGSPPPPRSPPPPGSTPLLETGGSIPLPVSVQPSPLPPVVRPSEGGFYYR
jgi:hypothetical protein